MNGGSSDQEESELETWMNLSEKNRVIAEEFLQEEKLQAGIAEIFLMQDRIWGRLENEINKQSSPRRVKHLRMTWTRVAAAAVILLLLSVGGYFYFNRNMPQPLSENKKDVEAPKETKAMITLANGQKVFLDSVSNGTLATLGNVKVEKRPDGQITYTGTGSENQYNTLTNPRGSKVINLVLADGSKVWLNAESSLRYPVAFTGGQRDVEITGEAYFEVVHNAMQPFHVHAHGVDIEDVGTAFNINSYDNEQIIKTTLVEGSVKVTKGNANTILKPGQQAQVTAEIKVIDADVDVAIAWKNGITKFKRADIKSIMRQVERWYDIDVVYEGNISQRNFTGGVSREANLSELLKILELSNIHCRIEGKKLVVMQ